MILRRRPLDCFSGHFWVKLDRGQEVSLGGFLGFLRRPLGGLLAVFLRPPGASWWPLGGILGAAWGPLGASWGHLGAESSKCRFVLPLWGPSWGFLGALLSRRNAEKRQMPKSFKNRRAINDFSFFGPSWRTSWKPLGPSWRPLGGLLGHLEAILGRLGCILGRLGGILGPS